MSRLNIRTAKTIGQERNRPGEAAAIPVSFPDEDLEEELGVLWRRHEVGAVAVWAQPRRSRSEGRGRWRWEGDRGMPWEPPPRHQNLLPSASWYKGY